MQKFKKRVPINNSIPGQQSSNSLNNFRQLFKELDDLLLGGITIQINTLCSYFRNEVIKHLSIMENAKSVYDLGEELSSTNVTSDINLNQIRERFGDQASIDLPDHLQQLLIEYTLLPVCRIPVDPTPSPKFSLSFINEVLFKQFQLNTNFSENVNHLFSSIIIPLLTDGDLNTSVKSMDDLKEERKGQFIVFLNSYFASLVFFCQFELLKQLSDWMFLFSTNVKIWTIKSFFTKYITTSQSKCHPLRELAQKVLSKYQKMLINEEGHFVTHNINNNFLTDRIIEQSVEPLIRPPNNRATIAFNLVLKLLNMSLNEYSQEDDKKSHCLNHCIEILKHGNLFSIMGEKQNSLKKMTSNLKGFYILLSAEYGHEMMEMVWNMLYAFIEDYTSDYFKESKLSLKIGSQLITLFDLIYPSIEKTQVTNYFYLNDCFIPFTWRLVKTLNSRFDSETVQSLSVDIKLVRKAVHIFVKHSTKTSNNLDALQFFKVLQEPSHCSKLSMKKFISDISGGILFESLLYPSKFLLRDTLSSVKTEELYSYLENILLIWTNYFFYLYNSYSLERVLEKNISQSDGETDSKVNNEVIAKFRHLDKLNVIFTQLVECACMFDYNQFVNRSLSESPISKFIHLSKNAENLNELVRAILVVILQKPFIGDILSSDNLSIISERLGLSI